MKTKLSIVFFALISIGLFFASCDKIPPPYGTTIEQPDTVLYPPPAFVPNTSAQRTVLVEDYTGHRCGNCPDAGVILKDLIETQNGKIIGLAIHVSEQFGAPNNDYPEDFRTPTGNEWDAVFGISSAGQPNGMVNRKLFGGQKIVNPSQWGSNSATILQTAQADVDIQIKNYHDTANGKIISYIYTSFLTAMPGNYKLGAYVMEDSITAPQKWYSMGFPNDHDSSYVHMHMLRGNINGVWGETIKTGGAAQGWAIRKDYKFSISSEWNIKHTKVLAFVYDQDTYEIIQTVEKDFLE